MTKIDFENLSKEVRSVSDRLIRIETTLEAIGKQLSDGAARFNDHETRLRLLETSKNKMYGLVTGLSFAAGLIAGIIAKIL